MISEEVDGRPCRNFYPKQMPPDEINWQDNPVMLEIKEFAQNDRCVSIGEIGLDYYWVKDEKARAWQKYFFKAQLEMAAEMDLPVIVHSREAAADTFSIMKVLQTYLLPYYILSPLKPLPNLNLHQLLEVNNHLLSK